MKAYNEIEHKVLNMIAEGKPLRGEYREIAIEMAQREMED